MNPRRRREVKMQRALARENSNQTKKVTIIQKEEKQEPEIQMAETITNIEPENIVTSTVTVILEEIKEDVVEKIDAEIEENEQISSDNLDEPIFKKEKKKGGKKKKKAETDEND